SGLGLLVGTKTSSRSVSTDITDQTFAAPVRRQLSPAQVERAGSDSCVGIGSQLQRSAPLFASYARTTPRSRSAARVSPIDTPREVMIASRRARSTFGS